MHECDQRDCPARGAVEVATHAGSLFFCFHHARENFTLEFDELYPGLAVLLKFDGTVEFREKEKVA